MGAARPLVTILRVLESPQQLSRPEPFPGQHSLHPPVYLGPRDSRHLPPKPVASQQERSAQQVHGYVVMSASPAPGLVFVQSQVAILSLELRFYAPPGIAHVRQGLQSCVFGSIGHVLTRLAAVQGPAIDSP